MAETDYQRAWRERGEVEQALRQWNRNQSSPTIIKIMSVVAGLVGAGLVGAGLVGAFIKEPSWAFAPALVLAAMFIAMLFTAPSMLENEVENRAKAKETLERLGVWDKDRGQ